MEDTKKTVLAGNGEKDVPRAVYDGVLTIDVDAQVESMEEQEEARWHQLLNAHRTRKILTGQLGGIEKLESGWMVAVTYFNGFRIIILMNEMMINLQGDGRENADTLNRQVRIANNMLGCDIDFIIKDLDNKSRSVVASRKDAMLKKIQTFYIGEDTEKPMLYEGRIVEARVIAVAPKAVRLEVTTQNIGSLKGKYAITSNYPLNFHAMLLKLANSQDIGFGYYTDTLELNLEVDWPDEATVKIIKKDKGSNVLLAGAVYGIYADEACTKLIKEMPATNAKGESEVKITKTQDTVYLREISGPSGYVLKTGRGADCFQELNG